MLSFNNRRVLHARRGFELNGGVRHMQVSAAFWGDDVTSCESVNFVICSSCDKKVDRKEWAQLIISVISIMLWVGKLILFSCRSQ